MAGDQRIPSLDGWRALAISSVLYAHWWFYAYGDRSKGGIEWGTLGVYIFFVVSGFIITRLLIEERDRTNRVSLKAFYVRRVFRIFPPLIVFLLGLAVLTKFGLSESSPRLLLTSLGFIRNYRPGPYPSLRHLWSLSVEEQFYLVWPFLFTRMTKKNSLKLLVSVILAAPVIRVVQLVWLGGTLGWHTESVADGLAIGCLLAIGQRELHANRFYEKFSHSNLSLLIPLVTLTAAYESYPILHQGLGKSLIFLSVALSIDISIQRFKSVAGRILNSKPFVLLGRLSYSLYLWQEVFLLVRRGDHPYAWFPMNLALPLLLAITSYYLIEKPAIRCGRELLAREKIRSIIRIPNTVQ